MAMGKAIDAVPPVNIGAPYTGRTLGQLVQEKMALLAICRRCKHQRVLYPSHYIAPFGEHSPAVALRKHLRCSKCSSRLVNLYESAR
jgi:hypothetical protein